MVWMRAIGKASFHPIEVPWVIFFIAYFNNWLALSILKTEASRHNGIISNAQCFRDPLEVNDVPLSLCNDLGRPSLRMISWCSFLPPPQPSQSGWESLQFILWMYLSWLIGTYTLEKLASWWSPSASPLLDWSHVFGWAGPAGVFEHLGVV